MTTVLKVSVLANGTVLLGGNPVTLEALARAMDAAPDGGTQVWYYRENAAAEAPAAAIPVMKLTVPGSVKDPYRKSTSLGHCRC